MYRLLLSRYLGENRRNSPYIYFGRPQQKSLEWILWYLINVHFGAFYKCNIPNAKLKVKLIMSHFYRDMFLWNSSRLLSL